MQKLARNYPICPDECDQYVGRVSWPADLLNSRRDEGSASTYVCANNEHQEEAAAWVETVTGHRGVFVPWAPAQTEGSQ